MPEPKPPRINVTVRLSQTGIDAIDRLRGAWSRSDFIRHAISDAVKRGEQGPKEPDL